jgi:hypothetical protein
MPFAGSSLSSNAFPVALVLVVVLVLGFFADAIPFYPSLADFAQCNPLSNPIQRRKPTIFKNPVARLEKLANLCGPTSYVGEGSEDKVDRNIKKFRIDRKL